MSLALSEDYEQEQLKTVIEEYEAKIEEAQLLIQRAETDLAIKFKSVHGTLRDIERQIAEAAIVIEATTNLMPKEVCADTDDGCGDSNKQLYKKIAQLTHPDKCHNDKLFKEAKKALKAGNREKLLEILTLAKSEYVDLLNFKKKVYVEIVESVQYLMARDYYSGIQDNISKAETYYLQVLYQTLQAKLSMLHAMKK